MRFVRIELLCRVQDKSLCRFAKSPWEVRKCALINLLSNPLNNPLTITLSQPHLMSHHSANPSVEPEKHSVPKETNVICEKRYRETQRQRERLTKRRSKTQRERDGQILTCGECIEIKKIPRHRDRLACFALQPNDFVNRIVMRRLNRRRLHLKTSQTKKWRNKETDKDTDGRRQTDGRRNLRRLTDGQIKTHRHRTLSSVPKGQLPVVASSNEYVRIL